jgi:phosphatidylinositol kinase/protein kinase (PI-3  family)
MTNNVPLIQAWDLYYGVFKRIARQLPQLMSLELQYVSPELKNAHDLDLPEREGYHQHQVFQPARIRHLIQAAPS